MRRSPDENGFTLVEVLVAFTIAVVLLLPLLHSFLMGMTSASRTDALDEATVIAQSTIEAIGRETPLANATDIERQEGRYHVSAQVARYDGDGAINGPILPVVPYDVAVTVRWREGPRARSVALHAIRLGPPPARRATP